MLAHYLTLIQARTCKQCTQSLHMCIQVAKSVLCIRILQAAEMTFTRTTYISNSLLQHKRQITSQEFGESSLWRLLVSNEMGG